MKILFIHQNFPAQYRRLIPALLKRGDSLVAISQQKTGTIEGVVNLNYSLQRGNLPQQHPWLISVESAVLRAEAVAKRCQQLKNKGYTPDVILIHTGWGEALFIKDIWSDVKVIGFFEYFYPTEKKIANFDPEFPIAQDTLFQFRMKNSLLLSSLESCDIGVTSTQWQHSLFPQAYKNKIVVLHEGINTKIAKPNKKVRLHLANIKKIFSKKTPIITFVSRNLEPARGYHRFIRALPIIQKYYPNVHIIIVGGEGNSYSKELKQEKSYKQLFLNEVKDKLDMSKIHFLGKVSYTSYINILQISTVHVYLSYPFFISWSLLEAMSISCRIVAANTKPIKEVLQNKKSGLLVDFFSTEELVSQVINILHKPEKYRLMGREARKHILKKFDFETVILPQQLQLIDENTHSFSNDFLSS